jgi:protein-disulfide isomerase
MRNLSTLTLIALGGALALGACGSSDSSVGSDTQQDAVAKVAAPKGQKWSDVITATTDGGFVMGNPEAKIKLVEYGSLTCHVCADFAQNAEPKIVGEFVDSGQVAYEFRNYKRNQLDTLAAAAMQCAGKDRYYPLMHNIYVSQEELFKGAEKLEQAAQAMQSQPDNQKFITYAKGAGLYDFYKARGLSEQQLDQCYGDPANVLGVQARSDAAGKQFNIVGTPTFVLNGEPFSLAQGVEAVVTISEKLRAAGAR